MFLFLPIHSFLSMKKLLAFLAFVSWMSAAVAQDLVLTPVPAKSAPAEATLYLKNQKLKPKKAKWSKMHGVAFVADFQKKKETKVAYFFTPEGRFLYKRTPLPESELPKELKDVVGDRMQGPGTKLYLFQSNDSKIYAVSVPREA